MTSRLPVIVGFGGFNAAGRSSGHQAYKRMILESLGVGARHETLAALAAIMGLSDRDETVIANGTLVRKIETAYFDPDGAPLTKKYTLDSNSSPASVTVSRRNLPSSLPSHWYVEPLDEQAKICRVSFEGEQDIRVNTQEPIAVKTAGQLPSGFAPGAFYRSLNHPRGLQLAILGASDAVQSLGIKWSNVTERLSPDEISVYSASIMSQLDSTGFGGLFNGRLNGGRASSKQVALGLNSMPADFINAYVLGSMGATGGTTGACATFLYNLRQGVEDIRSGRRKVSVVGASEAPILPEIIDGYTAMGALATDVELQKLDGLGTPDYRRASRPFGHNCGFTLAESSQYVVLMSDELAVELGARIYAAVPGVYINADGYKKSISAPGAGNYITMGKAVGLARTLLGDEAVRRRSVVQAHGSSTPQNRVSESKIFHKVATAFGIESWPIGAVKAYLGHSLAAASGDQLMASLGLFEHGLLPGIKTMTEIAPDVHASRLNIPIQDLELGKDATDVVFLNSKGFGGNNATATVFSPSVVKRYLRARYQNSTWQKYEAGLEETELAVERYLEHADRGDLNPIYEFGNHLVDEEQIRLDAQSMQIPGHGRQIKLDINEGFSGFSK